MLRATTLVAVAALIVAAAALAGTPKAPGVTAKVTETSSSVTITITNKSAKKYKGYFVNSTDSPKLTAASDTSCRIGKSKPYKSGGKKHYDYYADCRRTLKAHKTFTVTLTSSGSGTVFVWVKTKSGYEVKVGQGG
jgi:hypothetical protein